MGGSTVIGRWRCHRVIQKQSESSAETAGPYPDEPRETEAAESDFAGATLEFFADGKYELKAADAHNSSRGTWTTAGKKLTVTQDPDVINGHERIAFVTLTRGHVHFAYTLVPDAHDGLDTLVLEFERDKPRKKASVPSGGFIEQFLAAKSQSKIYGLADKALAGPDAIANARLLWDAWVDGRFPGPMNAGFDDRVALLGDERVVSAGAFTLAHARHALEKDPRDLGYVDYSIQKALRNLPPDPAESELAATVSSGWLASLGYSRIIGGGMPEDFFARPLLPQPATDDATRARLREVPVFSRLDALAKLYPPGSTGLADIIWRYRGFKLLLAPLALIEERRIEREVIASTTGWLAKPENLTAVKTAHASALQSAVLFNVVLSSRLGVPLGPEVIAALGVECRYTDGGVVDEEKVLLRELAVPPDVAALVRQRFYL